MWSSGTVWLSFSLALLGCAAGQKVVSLSNEQVQQLLAAFGHRGGLAKAAKSGGGGGGGGLLGSLLGSAQSVQNNRCHCTPSEPPSPGEDACDCCCWWAQQGECSANPLFMPVFCQASCGSLGCGLDSASCSINIPSTCRPKAEADAEEAEAESEPVTALPFALASAPAPAASSSPQPLSSALASSIRAIDASSEPQLVAAIQSLLRRGSGESSAPAASTTTAAPATQPPSTHLADGEFVDVPGLGQVRIVFGGQALNAPTSPPAPATTTTTQPPHTTTTEGNIQFVDVPGLGRLQIRIKPSARRFGRS